MSGGRSSSGGEVKRDFVVAAIARQDGHTIEYMDNRNSLGFYTELVIASYSDVASASGISVRRVKRDIEEMRNRVKCEGLSFLTRTLPAFGKSIDKALASGNPLTIPGFECEEGTAYPHFLGEYVKRLFTPDGYERREASDNRSGSAGCEALSEPLDRLGMVDALRSIRQVCYTLYKLDLPPTENQLHESIKEFIQTDNELPDPDASPVKATGIVHTDNVTQAILRCARGIVCRVLGTVSPYNINNTRHGTGSVSDGIPQWEKSDFITWSRPLERLYPYSEYGVYNLTHLSDLIDHRAEVHSVDFVDAPLAKLVAVPKDSRGPRLISCEPSYNQWIQQGQRVVVETAIRKCPITRGHVNFRDQTVNRQMALQASIDQEWVTLDMKEASDRVSIALVKALLPHTWFEAVIASRSVGTCLPCGSVHMLKKFAPMGSSLCFPIESLVFFALVTSIIYVTSNKSLREAGNGVYVYGDDILCRSEDYRSVLALMPNFYLKFNVDKCCVAGSFRESCGLDAYHGADVTPARLRAQWVDRIGVHLATYIAFHNALQERGMYTAAELVLDRIYTVTNQIAWANAEMHERLPYALYDPRIDNDEVRYRNRHLRTRRGRNGTCNLQYRCYSIVPRYINTRGSGWSEMLRVITERGGLAPSDKSEVRAYRYAVANAAVPRFVWTDLYGW